MQNWNRATVVAAMAWSVVVALAQITTAQPMDPPRQFSAATKAGQPSSGYDPATDEALFLLVTINGREIGLIAEFTLSRQSRRMAAQRSELEGIGIAAPRHLGQMVFLDQIPDFAFTYDVAAQRLLITVQGPAQMPVEISAAPQEHHSAAQANYGLVLNYRATANLGNDILGDGFDVSAAFALLELRLSTPQGVLTNTAAISVQGDDRKSPDLMRYDSYFSVASPDHLTTMTLGDFTTSGMGWTRPVRLGGILVRRDYSLRDDVVSSPLLSYSATAAVPSSIDVYIDNVRAYSGSVGQGPFRLSDVPMITGEGEAIFTLRDAGGNAQVTKVPFFASQNFLSAGLVDFTVALGHARRGYGTANDSYLGKPAGVLGLRYGVSDKLTIGGHTEGMDGLLMAGLGLDAVLWNRAEVGVAAGASIFGDQRGQFFFGTLRTRVATVDLRWSTRRSFADFRDLSSATAIGWLDNGAWGGGAALAATTAQDVLSLAFPPVIGAGALGVNLIHSERTGGAQTIVSVSYAQQLPWQAASFRANAFRDMAQDGGYGVAVGLSVPLGGARFASIDLGRDRLGGVNARASLSRVAERKSGSAGYRVNLSPQNSAVGVTRQASFGRADLALREGGLGIAARATFDGALIWAGGGLFASNRITDGYAVVDVGVPDVPVSLNNRAVARTGMFGRALVSGLGSYRPNRISINPLDLPTQANIAASAITVVPARRSGVTVDFGGQPSAAALVVLRDPAGAFLPAGADVQLHGARTSFVMGYDGEVWIAGLAAQNLISVRMDGKTCSAAFSYAAQQGAQTYIDGIECK